MCLSLIEQNIKLSRSSINRYNVTAQSSSSQLDEGVLLLVILRIKLKVHLVFARSIVFYLS